MSKFVTRASKQQSDFAISPIILFSRNFACEKFRENKTSRKLPNLQEAEIMPPVPFGPSKNMKKKNNNL